MSRLNVEYFGPESGSRVLAIHGVTGHGKRWSALASEQLPDHRVIAPDLLGHGFSPWNPPWSIGAQVDALRELLHEIGPEPVIVVGHSFGGALGLHLAAREPDRVRSLVLLDPAIGIDPEMARTAADDTIDHWYYDSVADARADKLNGAWSEAGEAAVEAEIVEHLITDHRGRLGWRVSPAAVVTTFSELAAPWVIPPPSVPVWLVQATRVQPPYVRPELVRGLSERSQFTYLAEDCDHMVPQALPELVGRLIRDADRTDDTV
ncbi:alpha/beta fold hydrolase [Williamsia sterculiae]|uniref:Lipase n=1 Tax=Williamsia sterculiae TaxID=1344003 RepID=A0A1N7FY53_9NOCA|nr:alpha/beta hydrolase [Williamsia sterculiae]SIS05270.1 lipase [Williamsia sterculiae]